MSNTVYVGFGSGFGPSAAVQDLVSGPSNTTIVRLITSDVGQRSSITKIQGVPLPLAALPAGSVWQFRYFVVRTKQTYLQLQQNNFAALSQAPFIPGMLPPGLQELGSQWEGVWSGMMELSQNLPVVPFDFNENEIICENGSCLAVCCTLGKGVDYATLATTLDNPGHFDILTVQGKTVQMDGSNIFPYKGRSLPTYDL